MILQQRLWVILAISGVAVLKFLPANHFSSDSSEVNHCLHYKIFGFRCPGCGFTRGVHAMLHLKMEKALSFNPSVIFTPPILLLEVLLIRTNFFKLQELRKHLYDLFVIMLTSVYIQRIAELLNTY